MGLTIYHSTVVACRGYICSGHVLVNHERQQRKIPKLQRSEALDLVARQEAEQIAQSYSSSSKTCSSSSTDDQTTSTSTNHDSRTGQVEASLVTLAHKSAYDEMVASIQQQNSAASGNRPQVSVAENVVVGDPSTSTCVQQLHVTAMKESMKPNCSDIHKEFRLNILSTSFTELGVGTAKAADGSLCLVHIFRGTTNDHLDDRTVPNTNYLSNNQEAEPEQRFTLSRSTSTRRTIATEPTMSDARQE